MKKKLFFSALAALLSVSALVVYLNMFSRGTEHIAGYADIMEEEIVQPRSICIPVHRKSNVKTYYEYSPYERISDNCTTESEMKTVQVTSDDIKDRFEVIVEGNVDGLKISKGISDNYVNPHKICSFNVAPNQSAYVKCRAYYKVETGINEYYDIFTGEVKIAGSYTVKVPVFKEFGIVSADK